MTKIKSIIFDYDGVFTRDDYTPVFNALNKSSHIDIEEISRIVSENERKLVISPNSTQFLKDIKKIFRFPRTLEELTDLFNQRGDTYLYDELPKFKRKGFHLSILSNQLAYRVPFVRNQLETRFGLANFVKLYFSPEIRLQKPFVGVYGDSSSSMDISKADIFPLVVRDMKELGYSPEECLFIDDSLANITSASRYKINGMVFKNVIQMKEILAKDYRIVLD